MDILETIKQLDTKQKITGVITVFLLVFLVYLAYDTFTGNGSSAPSVPAQSAASSQVTMPEDVQNDAANDPDAAVQMHELPPQPSIGTQPAPASANVDPMAQQDLSQPDDDQVVKQQADQPSPEQQAFLQQTKQMQQDYLQLVNEFQLAQLQQKLEDAKAQIADARLKSIVSTAKQQQLEDELQQKGQSIAGSGISNAAPAGVQVVYVGQRRGQWTAMLNEGGAYFEVHVGTRLGDGWQVTRIDSNGVILQRDDEKRFLRMPRVLG